MLTDTSTCSDTCVFTIVSVQIDQYRAVFLDATNPTWSLANERADIWSYISDFKNKTDLLAVWTHTLVWRSQTKNNDKYCAGFVMWWRLFNHLKCDHKLVFGWAIKGAKERKRGEASVILLNNHDLSIDSNDHDYAFCNNRVALVNKETYSRCLCYKLHTDTHVQDAKACTYVYFNITSHFIMICYKNQCACSDSDLSVKQQSSFYFFLP